MLLLSCLVLRFSFCVLLFCVSLFFVLLFCALLFSCLRPLRVPYQDRMVCVLCNLKPAAMRGVKSHAMVLAASNADHTQVRGCGLLARHRPSRIAVTVLYHGGAPLSLPCSSRTALYHGARGLKCRPLASAHLLFLLSPHSALPLHLVYLYHCAVVLCYFLLQMSHSS